MASLFYLILITRFTNYKFINYLITYLLLGMLWMASDRALDLMNSIQ